MEQFFIQNSNVFFTLLGTIIGVAFTFFGTWILQNQAAKTRLLEKILDRRIQAHENIIELSKQLRVMISMGYAEEIGELARSPSIMASKENFDNFLYSFSQIGNENSTWLSTKVTHEYNFIQDYFVNLYEFTKDIDSKYFQEIGRLIRQDFIDFSSNLEKLSFEFFGSELIKLKLNDLSKWHKYPVALSSKRLNETDFFRNKEIINKFKK